MSRRWLQNLCILGIFIIAFTAVVAVGIDQGIREHKIGESGMKLEEKLPWEEAITRDPAAGSPTSLKDTDIVYTSPSGGKYHLYHDCSYLSRSKKIIGQPFENIKKAGMGICSRCKKRYEYAMREQDGSQ